MKIYTKTGDDGTTSLIGGKRVQKSDLRIEAYGTVDELNSWIGLLLAECRDETIKSRLSGLQDNLFIIGSNLAMDPDKSEFKLPEITEDEVLKLEKNIDSMSESLPPLKNFILPGGSTEIAHIHIARCVCRRAERAAIRATEEGTIQKTIVLYLNRLSDFLFVFARFTAMKTNAQETIWKT
jgi:cob(I)alamin adenosyltransferase